MLPLVVQSGAALRLPGTIDPGRCGYQEQAVVASATFILRLLGHGRLAPRWRGALGRAVRAGTCGAPAPAPSAWPYASMTRCYKRGPPGAAALAPGSDGHARGRRRGAVRNRRCEQTLS